MTKSRRSRKRSFLYPIVGIIAAALATIGISFLAKRLKGSVSDEQQES